MQLLPIFAHAPFLRSVHVCCWTHTSVGFRALTQLSYLNHLSILNARRLDFDGLLALLRLPYLENLPLRGLGERLGDGKILEAFRRAESLPRVERATFSGKEVTNLVLNWALSALPNLKSLELVDCPNLDEDALAELLNTYNVCPCLNHFTGANYRRRYIRGQLEDHDDLVATPYTEEGDGDDLSVLPGN